MVEQRRWFTAVVTSLLYEQSRLALVVFAVVAQLVALPIFFFASKLAR